MPFNDKDYPLVILNEVEDRRTWTQNDSFSCGPFSIAFIEILLTKLEFLTVSDETIETRFENILLETDVTRDFEKEDTSPGEMRSKIRAEIDAHATVPTQIYESESPCRNCSNKNSTRNAAVYDAPPTSNYQHYTR